MKQDAKEEPKKTVSIQVGLQPGQVDTLEESVQIEKSDSETIVIRVHHCEFLKIDLGDSQCAQSLDTQYEHSAFPLKPQEDIPLQNDKSGDTTERADGDSENQARHHFGDATGLPPDVLSTDNVDALLDKFAEIPIEFSSEQSSETDAPDRETIEMDCETAAAHFENTAVDNAAPSRGKDPVSQSGSVPLARVRWSDVPPAPDAEGLIKSHRLGDGGNVSIQPTLSDGASSTLRTDETLQSIRTSMPPMPKKDVARRRRPIYFISAAALLVMAGAVGLGMLLMPREPLQSVHTTTSNIRTHAAPNVANAKQIALSADSNKNSTIDLSSLSLNIEDAKKNVAAPGSQAHVKKRIKESFDHEKQIGADVPSNMVNSKPVNARTLTDVERKNKHSGGQTQKSDDSVKAPNESVASASNLNGPATDLLKLSEDDERQVRLDSGQNAILKQKKDTHHMEGTAGDATMPMRPSRAQVKEAMDEITPYIHNCKFSRTGRLVLEMVVAGESGKVLSARVLTDEFAGSATGYCATKVARTATLPTFQQETVTIKYPFEL
ncbi:MAG: hypothetical protein JXR76_04920 [Deltaproteobacteria bacterium]|nr:hypothetical protein [Deltaproteobacteria bacterium]